MNRDTIDKVNKKKDFWKSLKEYYDDPKVFEAKANEFADGVTDDFDPATLNKFSRRKFLALISASAAFAATACSDYRDKGEIIPYNKRPVGVLPGKPNFYASTVNGKSVLVRVREGRPINIEGNPDHPVVKGKIDAQTPATLLNLYDPERLKEPTKEKRKTTWKTADAEIIDKLNAAVSKGKEIALISNRITSPTYLKLVEDFKKKYTTTKHYSYETFHDENRKAAWQKSYGNENVPAIKWNDAKVILSFDADFLSRDENAIENARLFAESKDVVNGAEPSRLYVAEGNMSLTGMNADYRLRVRPDAQLDFVLSLLNEIILNRSVSNISLSGEIRSKIESYSLAKFCSTNNIDKSKANKLVEDLLSNKGKSIAYCGSGLPVEVHTAVNLLNEVLGNAKLYDFKNSFVSLHHLSSNGELKELATKIDKGNVGVIVNLNSNPVYHFPSDLRISEAISKVETVISISEHENETTNLSHFILPANHELESWGDSQTRTNLYDLRQPVIAPIYNTRQVENVLLTWVNGSAEAYSDEAYHLYLQDNFREYVYSKMNTVIDSKNYWFSSLHDGFVELKSNTSTNFTFNQNVLDNLKSDKKSDGFVLQLQPSYFVGDGKFANNGWLQEIPHPVSKIAWDNYAAVSPNTAKELGVENNDLIEIDNNGNKLTIAVFVQPGLSDKTIVIELGYGREVVGDVGKNVGFNANKLMRAGSDSPWIYNENVTVTKLNETYKLVSTQEHHSLDDESVKDFHLLREIIREVTVAEYKANPSFLHEEKHELHGITREHKYENVKWGMSIDLNKCISCASCVTSCNIENNVPVVGKDQVSRGREMQWIRIDRYYSGTPDEPIVSNQPMLCQHCDNAPCENVCPVNATNHSPDGLNQMVYNRCVGTRYCANNCPYKVRRFNFYNFRDHFADAYYENELTSLVINPEVTVRSRGVMEKCTFCVQRIMEARSEAIRESRELKGSDVITACESACPTNAIVFGDTNDRDSEVARYREHDLGYHVLEELYVKPNITYIAKLRNTDSEEA